LTNLEFNCINLSLALVDISVVDCEAGLDNESDGAEEDDKVEEDENVDEYCED
jgi:hypothetical protein